MSRKNFFWIACLVAGMLLFRSSFAATVPPEQTSRCIRVGSIDIDNFLEVNADGSMRGYGVAYLDEIAKHTGWSYSYIPGSWSDCMQWLREGKIDLLFPAERSPEREKTFIFSKESCCMDYVALYTRSDNNTLFYQDYHSFNGLTVGMINDNQLNESFDIFLKNKHIRIKRRYFPEVESMKRALEHKEIDAIVYGVMNEDPHQKLLAKIDYMHAYFMMEKKNTVLMEELERALHELYLDNPYFTSRLYEQYYKEIDRQAVGFTREEIDFIQKTGSVPVACDTDSYPLEWYDAKKKRYEGVYPDILRKIEAQSGLSFQFLPASATAKAWERLKSKEATLLASATDIPNLRISHDMICSDSYYKENNTLIGKRGVLFEADTPYRIAVQEDQIGIQQYILEEYPHWNIVPCVTIRDCFIQISAGKADIAAINSIVLQVDPYLNMANELTTIFTTSITIPVSIGMSADQRILCSILNKSIHKLTDKDIHYSVLSNTLEAKRRISFSNFILYFPKTSVLFACLFSSLALFFLFIVYKNRLQFRQNRILAENYRQLQEVIQQREELKTKAEMDMLTGLYNKVTFRKLATCLLERKNRDFTLFFLDMDNFKLLNDQYGHVVGDTILKNVASILKKHFREEDLVGRFGGDEFYVFIPTIPEQALFQKLEFIAEEISALQLNEKTTKALSEPFQDENALLTRKWQPPQRGVDFGENHVFPQNDALKHSVFQKQNALSISIGIARSPEHGNTFEELLFKADKALYQAKAFGRNRIEIYKE